MAWRGVAYEELAGIDAVERAEVAEDSRRISGELEVGQLVRRSGRPSAPVGRRANKEKECSSMLCSAVLLMRITRLK